MPQIKYKVRTLHNHRTYYSGKPPSRRKRKIAYIKEKNNWRKGRWGFQKISDEFLAQWTVGETEEEMIKEAIIMCLPRFKGYIYVLEEIQFGKIDDDIIYALHSIKFKAHLCPKK